MERVRSYLADADWSSLTNSQKYNRRKRWKRNPQFVMREIPNIQPALPNIQPALPNIQPALPNIQPALPNIQPALPNLTHNECGVCFDPTVNKTACCNQNICLNCLVKWSYYTYKRSCPYCRQDYTVVKKIKQKVNVNWCNLLKGIFIIFICIAIIILAASFMMAIVEFTDPNIDPPSQRIVDHWISAMGCLVCRIQYLSDKSRCIQCQTECAPIQNLERVCSNVLRQSQS